MNEEKKLIDKVGKESPWRVPEGYFDSVRAEIISNLPDYRVAPKPQKLSTWHRVRPYVYLAAMFAGIWCMMKVFHNVSGMNRLSIENPPENIAALMADPEITDTYMLPTTISDEELLNEVSDSYASIDEFEKDFGYSFEPEYDNIDISKL
ncbi:MAG: hypothetical protein NC204_03150 [Candidatus Amulumruptor caecigallinarius]|nr:hypothetical protein [Candidatus Amulumruptor caecigallinarius]